MKIFIILLLITVLSACGRDNDIGGALPIIEPKPGNYHAEVVPVNIRVLIGTSGFEGLIHNSVEITSDKPFFVRTGEETKQFGVGEIFRLPDFGEGERFYITGTGGKLEIMGLRRNWQGGANPKYLGVLEITRRDSGYTIINELPLEQYLYAVVPSEMPSSYGVEASKVQAITARTFAYYQIRENNFREYGADVDDSVISQVYNNIPENEISIEAVRATQGKVLTYNGEIILANYFSTSGGTTANFGEVWATDGVFPSNTPAFLRARAQLTGLHPGNLRTEEDAAAFFKNTEINAFDKNFPWFRWQVTMTAEEISERINKNLPARFDANPALIDFAFENTTGIGILRNMEVLRRGQGGNVMEMIFYGTENSVRVLTEFNIRALLNPADIPVIRHDGSLSSNLSLLPSAFFTFEINDKITFFGGGNGHGVGMSQNGVRALLDMGISYIEILQHYYPGTMVTEVKQRVAN